MTQHQKHLHKTVSFWVYVGILVLFIVLPLGGFYLGRLYQKDLDQRTMLQATPSPIQHIIK